MWWLLWLIPGIILLLLLWLLFAPIHLRIDTIKERFYLRVLGVARLWLDTREENWRIRLRIFFFSVKLKTRSERKEKEEKRKKKGKKPRKRRRRLTFRKALRYMRAGIRSIRLRQCYIELDTEDYARNAQLYALIEPLRRLGISLNVNFEGKNEVAIWIVIRGYRVAYNMIKTALGY